MIFLFILIMCVFGSSDVIHDLSQRMYSNIKVDVNNITAEINITHYSTTVNMLATHESTITNFIIDDISINNTYFIEKEYQMEHDGNSLVRAVDHFIIKVIPQVNYSQILIYNNGIISFSHKYYFIQEVEDDSTRKHLYNSIYNFCVYLEQAMLYSDANPAGIRNLLVKIKPFAMYFFIIFVIALQLFKILFNKNDSYQFMANFFKQVFIFICVFGFPYIEGIVPIIDIFLPLIKGLLLFVNTLLNSAINTIGREEKLLSLDTVSGEGVYFIDFAYYILYDSWIFFIINLDFYIKFIFYIFYIVMLIYIAPIVVMLFLFEPYKDLVSKLMNKFITNIISMIIHSVLYLVIIKSLLVMHQYDLNYNFDSIKQLFYQNPLVDFDLILENLLYFFNIDQTGLLDNVVTTITSAISTPSQINPDLVDYISSSSGNIDTLFEDNINKIEDVLDELGDPGNIIWNIIFCVFVYIISFFIWCLAFIYALFFNIFFVCGTVVSTGWLFIITYLAVDIAMLYLYFTKIQELIQYFTQLNYISVIDMTTKSVSNFSSQATTAGMNYLDNKSKENNQAASKQQQDLKGESAKRDGA